MLGVDVPDEPSVLLEHADVALYVDRRRRQPGPELLGGHVGLAEDRELVRVHQLEHRVEVVVARWAERHERRLLERDRLVLDVHPRALVETRRAGRILGVDAEPDAALATRVEDAERVLEKREPDPAAAPGLTNAERSDPTTSVAEDVAANHRSDLIAVAHDGPDLWVEVVGVEPRAPPLFVLEWCVAPLVLERLAERGVERRPVAVAKRCDGETFGPFGLGRGLVAKLDAHPVVAPHSPVPTTLQERRGGLVLGKELVPNRRGSEFSRAHFG